MFGKIITAMVTPFDKDDNINFEAMKKLVGHLIRNNTSAIVACGTTGESSALTDLERLVVFEKTVEYAGKIPVIGNVGTNCTKDTVDRIKKLDHLPLAGYMIVVPYFNKPDQQGIYQHFLKAASSTKKPVIIYNVPSRCGVDIETDTIKELAKIPNIIGIKEAGGNISKIRNLKEEIGYFKVYCGNDALLYDALMANADGVISVASHIFGKTINNIMQLIRTKQYDDAKAIFDIYYPKFTALAVKSNPVPVKAALNRLGFNVGSVRLPLTEMDNKLQEELYSVLGI